VKKTAVPSRKLAILISGSGSNLQAFIDATQDHSLTASIAVVISNRPGVKGLERASKAGVATEVVDHKQFKDRNAFERELMMRIDHYQPDAVVLAGFMRILGVEFVTHYLGKLFNIHPSLLPRYPGLHTHQRAIEARDKEAGASVHFVVPELDAGPVIIQARVPVSPSDDADSLAKRVLAQEHRIYPLAVQWFCDERLALTRSGATLDGQLLPPSGFQFQHS
jgi:phosphoribosylglycinamide formyltransferase-1